VCVRIQARFRKDFEQLPISIQSLRDASQKIVTAQILTQDQAAQSGAKTAFLCHSHEDQNLVKGLIKLMKDAGWSIYVDWQDGTMPTTVSKDTAHKIKQTIKQLDFFLFLATPNSTSSKWCPWEIGIADGVKHYDNLLIIPTEDSYGKHYGNEYLEIYRHIDLSDNMKLTAWFPNQYKNGVLLKNL
jgi:hypothetical protein